MLSKKFYINHLLFVLWGSTLILTGCDEENERRVSSDTLSIREIYGTYQIVADETDIVYAEAQLTRGAPPGSGSGDDFYIDLRSGDRLWLAAGDVTLPELELSDDIFSGLSENIGRHAEVKAERERRGRYFFLFFSATIDIVGRWYSASLERLTPNEDTYTMALLKSGRLYKSSVTVAEDFTLNIRNGITRFNRSTDDIELIWDNIDTNYSVEISANTSCTNGSFDEYVHTTNNDNGSHIIPAGALDSVLFSGQCSVSIAVSKIKTGILNSQLRGGIIKSLQVRQINLLSQP